MSNQAEAVPTNDSDQERSVSILPSENLEKQLAAGRKEFLDERLKMKGYSWEVLANQAGVSISTLDNYRSGKSKPQPATLWKLAHTLGISIEDMPR